MNSWSLGAVRGKGIVKDFGNVIYTLYLVHAIFKRITDKNLLYTHGTLLNVMCQPEWEGGFGGNRHMYVYD